MQSIRTYVCTATPRGFQASQDEIQMGIFKYKEKRESGQIQYYIRTI